MTASRDDRAILAERARALAEPVITPESVSTRDLLLVFARGSARYAIDTRYVMQVVPLSGYTPLPFAPAPCLGLAAVRGELFSLFDLTSLTGETSAGNEPRSVLLCGESRLELGLALDEALDLLEPSRELEPAHDESKLVSGVDARGFVVIDGAALLSDPRLTLPHQEVSP